MRGIFDSASPEQAFAQNKAATERRAAFLKEVAALKGKDKPTHLKNLVGYIEVKGAKNFNAEELMTLYAQMRDLKGYKEMIDFHGSSADTLFKDAPIVREFLAVAHHKLGDPDKAITVCQQLVMDGESNGEVFGALGKSYLIKKDAIDRLIVALDSGQDAASATVMFRKAFSFTAAELIPDLDGLREMSSAMLTMSRDAYERGFMETFEFYPGINAAYRYLEQGNINQARLLAELAYHATQRDGGLQQNTYWCATTMLEAACLIGAPQEIVDRAFNTVLKYEGSKNWYPESTLETLRDRVRPALQKLSHASTGEERDKLNMAIGRIGNVIGMLEVKVAAIGTSNLGGLAENTPPDLTEELFRRSWSSRGMSVHDSEVVGGNFRFCGPIPDYYITRRDRKEFTKLIDADYPALMKTLGLKTKLPPELRAIKTLKEISDPALFLKAVHLLVRTNFGNERKKIEIIDGKKHHKEHDHPTQAVNILSGIPHPDMELGEVDKKKARDARWDSDSRTSAAAVFASGLGDCRPHAACATQLLWDIWQSHHMNNALRDAASAKTPAERSAAIGRFQDIEQLHLRTFDVVVNAPINMHSKYKPVRPKKGKGINGVPASECFVYDPTNETPVEDHTMTMLVRKGENDKVQAVAYADSFYQIVYQWGAGDIELDKIKLTMVPNGKGILLPKITIPGGKLKNVVGAPDSSVEVELTPAPYAGLRTEVKVDPGLVFDKGLPVPGEFDLLEQLARRLEINERLAAATSWLAEQEARIAAEEKGTVIHPGDTEVITGPANQKQKAKPATKGRK